MNGELNDNTRGTARPDPKARAKVQAIFESVAALPIADRRAPLALLCAGNQALQAEVEALLASHDHAGQFLARPTADVPTSSTPDPIHEAVGSNIGQYKLLELIGEGGFGSVFMAEQREPVQRKVALKVIKPGMDSKLVSARFEAERQALALMDHPHIARVFDGGVTDAALGSRPYFVMEYVRGETIITFANAHRLDLKARLALFTQVCQAVQHAHTKGIIHRDLKPGNVLVSMTDGRPFAKVIDFGIAKATGSRLTDKTLFTEHRQLIGTPEYMSPEQAEGSPDIDTRTDVYALGVLLYELLTSATPFDAKRLRSAAFVEMQRIIKEEEPPSPSMKVTTLLQRPLPTKPSRVGFQPASPPPTTTCGAGAPPVSPPPPSFSPPTSPTPLFSPRDLQGDLDWIVMKALDKDRARRYESPNQLAADVQRHLSGEAVVAAPPTMGYRVRKFVKRNKGKVIAGSAVAAALLVGIAGTTWQWQRANINMAAAHRAEAAAQTAEYEQRELAISERDARQVSEAKTIETQRALGAIQYNSYVTNVSLAAIRLDYRQFDRARALLDSCPEHLRGWEWRWLDATADTSLLTLRGPTGGVYSASFSPDGSRIVTADDSCARVWDAATGTELQVLRGHSEEIWHASYSFDGSRILTASVDRTVRVWEAVTGKCLMELKGHNGEVYKAQFSPNGKLIVASSDDEAVRVWDAVTGSLLHELRVPGSWVRHASFSPDSTRLLTTSETEPARIWDVDTGATLFRVGRGSMKVRLAVFNTAGTRIITVSDYGDVDIHDASDGRYLVSLVGHRGRVFSASFSPNDRWIVTTDDRSARIWGPWSGLCLGELVGHSDIVRSAQFSPNSTRIVTACDDGTARLWDSPSGALLAERRGHQGGVTSASFSPDGNNIITSSYDGTARVWDGWAEPDSDEVESLTLSADSPIPSPDGRLIVQSRRIERESVAEVSEAATGRLLFNLQGHKFPIQSVAFSTSSDRIVTASSDKTARVWDATTGACVVELLGHQGQVSCALFSPDGTRIVTGSHDLTARVWDPATGACLAELLGHSAPVRSAAFTADGTRIITASTDNVTKVWNSVPYRDRFPEIQRRRAAASPDELP